MKKIILIIFILIISCVSVYGQTYATWDSATKASDVTLSNGDLSVAKTAASWGNARTTIGKDTGKWYWETSHSTASDVHVGITPASVANNACPGYVEGYTDYSNNGALYHLNVASENHGGWNGANKIIMHALDMDSGEYWLGLNGAWILSGNPATGTNPSWTGITGTMYAVVAPYFTNNAVTANFGVSAFTYSVPSGFNEGFYDGGVVAIMTLLQLENNSELLYGTSTQNISITTNVDANCRYSTTLGQDFASMNLFTDTGGLLHNFSAVGLSNGGEYDYYFKCQNILNASEITADYHLHFNVSNINILYATWDSATKGSDVTLTNGDLSVAKTAASWGNARTTLGKDSGKWYWETFHSTANDVHVGITPDSVLNNECPGYNEGYTDYSNNGGIYHLDVSSQNHGSWNGADRMIMHALDMDSGEYWLGLDGTWILSGNPATGVNPSWSGITGTMYAVVAPYFIANEVIANFGDSDFTYTVPSGFNEGFYNMLSSPPTYAEFESDSDTTNFSAVDVAAVDNPILANSNVKVEWKATGLNLDGADLDSAVQFNNNFVSVDSVAVSALNTVANITMKGVSYDSVNTYYILKDGVACGDCIKHSASPVKFEVSGFSNYTTEGNLTGIPEFSTMTMGLGLVSVLVGLVLLRRKE